MLPPGLLLLSFCGYSADFLFRTGKLSCVERELNHLNQVIRAPTRTLIDLFPATKSVRYDQGILARGANGGQQHAFSDRLRNLVLLLIEPKRSGHPAAARIETSQLD